MQFFNDRVFGPDAVDVLSTALNEWLSENKIHPGSEDAALAAGLFLALFIEGNMTLPHLRLAAARHKWLGGDAGDRRH